MTEFSEPCQRRNFVGDTAQQKQLAALINKGSLLNGWLITGGEGAGKATLAYRLARQILGDTEQSNNLIEKSSHPDLFLAERLYDEKKDVYASEIKVETIRKLTSFLSHTPSMGGWRVAIIDTADHLNRNAANALLKILEEPPRKTTLFLLSASPGHLLPTIRSRCRRIDLRPLSNAAVGEFLEGEGVAPEDEVIAAAKGRPGYALTLGQTSGLDAIKLVVSFLAEANGGNVMPVVQKLSLKASDELWPIFKIHLRQRLGEAIRSEVVNNGNAETVEVMTSVYDDITQLFARGEAINTDRGQMLLQAARLISNTGFKAVA